MSITVTHVAEAPGSSIYIVLWHWEHGHWCVFNSHRTLEDAERNAGLPSDLPAVTATRIIRVDGLPIL